MVIMCLANCPVSATVADEGDVTDATPQELPRFTDGDLKMLPQGKK